MRWLVISTLQRISVIVNVDEWWLRDSTDCCDSFGKIKQDFKQIEVNRETVQQLTLLLRDCDVNNWTTQCWKCAVIEMFLRWRSKAWGVLSSLGLL